MTSLTRCVVIAVAVCLAGQLAWGHSFPPLRTVVVQVEKCEVAVLVGYRPASGEASETLLAKIASQPKSHALEAAKNILAKEALAPLSFSVDKRRLVPTEVRAKIGVDPGGTRPMVVLRAQACGPGACHDQTAISSITEAGSGGNSAGQRRAGSYGPPATANASSGAAIATTPMCIVMCAANGPGVSLCSGPSQTRPSTALPAMNNGARISGSSR